VCFHPSTSHPSLGYYILYPTPSALLAGSTFDSCAAPASKLAAPAAWPPLVRSPAILYRSYGTYHVVKLPALSSLNGAGCEIQTEDTPGTLWSCLRTVLTAYAPKLWKIATMESPGWARKQGLEVGDILLTYEDAQWSLGTLHDWRQRFKGSTAVVLYVLRKSPVPLVSAREEGASSFAMGLTNVPVLGGMQSKCSSHAAVSTDQSVSDSETDALRTSLEKSGKKRRLTISLKRPTKRSVSSSNRREPVGVTPWATHDAASSGKVRLDKSSGVSLVAARKAAPVSPETTLVGPPSDGKVRATKTRVSASTPNNNTNDMEAQYNEVHSLADMVRFVLANMAGYVLFASEQWETVVGMAKDPERVKAFVICDGGYPNALSLLKLQGESAQVLGWQIMCTAGAHMTLVRENFTSKGLYKSLVSSLQGCKVPGVFNTLASVLKCFVVDSNLETARAFADTDGAIPALTTALGRRLGSVESYILWSECLLTIARLGDKYKRRVVDENGRSILSLTMDSQKESKDLQDAVYATLWELQL
jgi:hypothetical protein